MKQEQDKTTVLRVTTLHIPAGLVEKLILEAIGAPRDAKLTSDTLDGDGEYYRDAPGVRVTWSVTEPFEPAAARGPVSHGVVDPPQWTAEELREIMNDPSGRIEPVKAKP